MKLRTSALFVALTAVLAGVLVALPAEAASYKVFLKSSRVAINSNGEGKVALKCSTGRSTCKGKVYFARDSGKPRTRSFTIKAGRTTYVPIAMHTRAPIYPKTFGTQADGYKYINGVEIRINEDAPKNITHSYKRTVETPVTQRYITGTVSGTGFQAQDIRVDLLSLVRGGNVKVVKGVDVGDGGGDYKFLVKLGVNNGSSAGYRLRIRGTDQDGNRRTWYWRGSGGGVYLRDSQEIRADRTKDYRADFTYHQVSGSTSTNAEVSLVGAPFSFGGGTAGRRELDIPSCGNIFGQTNRTSNGQYRIGFIPDTARQRYMVGAKSGATKAFYGSGSERYGSCYDAMNYTRSTARSNLLGLQGDALVNAMANATGITLRVDASFSSAYRPTYHDRWIKIREKVPGVPVLDAPVVRELVGDSKGVREFTNMNPGDYWVEVGRRTGCSDWYGSVYANNRLYFKGADRYVENWKSFTKVSRLPGSKTSGLEALAFRANPNPATMAEQNRVPRGKKGWMYRQYCKAYGTGTVNSARVTDADSGRTITKKTSRNGRGAVVKGRVTRIGGKTNKEMLVRLSTTSGSRVLRTDVTDSKGRFYIAGLAPGSYKVSVNSDSWRGIGRTFSGRHSISVRANKGYNLGTLRFKH